MDTSVHREVFPGIRDFTFNPKHAVAWVEEKPTADQVSYAQDIFQELFQSAARPKSSSGNACVKLCGFIDRCSKSTSPSLQKYAFSRDTAESLWNFYVEWNEQDQHRAMRLVLDFLNSFITNNPDQALAETVKTTILNEIVSIITLQATRPSIKSAMLALDQFLQKSLIFLSDLLEIYRKLHQLPSGQDVTWDPIIAKILDRMDLQNVSPIAGKLLVTIFTSPWYKGRSERFLPDSWHRFIYEGLRLNIQNLEAIKLYTLMPLFQSDKEQSMKYLDDLFRLQSLTKDRGILDLNAMIWLAAMEAGKKVGVVGESGSRNGDTQVTTAPHLQEDVLEDILCHTSHQARSSAVAILIASPSKAKPFARNTLHLLRKYLPSFHADTDAKFRYDVLGFSRNMFTRMTGAITALRRDLERALKKKRRLGLKQEPNLDPSDMDIQREGLAKGLSLSLQQHEEFVEWYLGFLKHELVPTASYQRHITALRAMEFVLKSDFLEEDPSTKGAIDSHGPQFILTDTMWLRSVLDLVADPFEDVRETAAALLMLLSSKPEVSSKVSCIKGLQRPMLKEIRDFCGSVSLLASKTSRADHSDGVARSYEIYCRWTSSNGEKIAILREVIDQLEQRLSAAEKDLASAVLDVPVHGFFASLRHIWGACSNGKFSQEELASLEILQSRAVHCARTIWQIVRHVLCDDSPEGHLPEDLDEVEGLDTKDLLSYSFRAIHESSNLLRIIAGNAESKGKAGVLRLSHSTFAEIGNLTFDELSNLRHRGAFTTVSQTFTACCQLEKNFPASSSCPDSLLDRWYLGSLDCIYTQASTTRRSAGIPALIVGILSSNADRPSFQEVMRKLHEIALQPAHVTETDGSRLPQVHALNCIKDIFKSSYLSKRAEPYLTESLQLAATSLKSEVWAIRNCGLLLLRSLIDCLLGTNEDKTSIEAGWDGRTTKIAWHKYKGLPDLVVNLLEMGQDPETAIKASASAESVFPALDIIRRAGPPEEYKEKLYGIISEKYLGSHIWHIRELASRTLCTFLLRPEWIEPVRKLIKGSLTSANRLHGALMTFKYLLERLLDTMPHQLLAFSTTDLHIVLDEGLAPGSSAEWSTEVLAVYFEIINLVNALNSCQMVVAGQFEGRVRTYIGSGLDALFPSDLSLPKSALLRSKWAQAMVAYQLRQTSTDGPSLFGDLGMKDILASDINVACDALEAVLLNQQNVLETDPGSNTRLLRACMTACSTTPVPDVRALALLILCAQIDILLVSEVGVGLLPPQEELLSLWTDIQTKPMNPALGDAIIKASGPMMVAIIVQAPEGSDFQVAGWVRAWGAMISDALSVDNVFDTRMAAVTAIQSFSSHTTLKTPVAGHHLPWLLALYDALNDDDEEVRDQAAAATVPILGKPAVPIEAASRLLLWLGQHFASDEQLGVLATCRVIGHRISSSKLGSTGSVADVLDEWIPADRQLESAMRFDDSLFVVEEQNLYVDEVREAQRWAALLATIIPAPDAAGDVASLVALACWTTAALRTLVQITEKQSRDWVLGWTSKPEVFAICARIVIAGSTLAAMGQQEVQEELLKIKEVGSVREVHGLLLAMCEVDTQ